MHASLPWLNTPLDKIKVDKLKASLLYACSLRDASWRDSRMDPEDLKAMRDPPRDPLNLDDLDLRSSIRLFMDIDPTASQDVYNSVRQTWMDRHKDENILSHHMCRRKIVEITGITAISYDMCEKSCAAYTGPFANLEVCPHPDCDQPRYKVLPNGKKEAYRTFETVPIGPVLQALWRHPDTAVRLKYRRQFTQNLFDKGDPQTGHIPIDRYDDIFSGSDYLELVKHGIIRPNDMVLMYSIDGAQLYLHKQSDCWVYIWIIVDFHSSYRYLKRYVFPGGTIGGPNKPKLIDSFTYPGFLELAILMNEGLLLWDASIPSSDVFTSYPFLILSTADGPGQQGMNGANGHQAKKGCHVFCGINCRNKQGSGHYYPAMLKPLDAPPTDQDTTLGSLRWSPSSKESREAYDEAIKHLLSSRGPTNYRSKQTQAGFGKPSILSGLSRTLGGLALYTGDIMHWILNISELLTKLWLGTFDCIKPDTVENWPWAVFRNRETFAAHGTFVASCRKYLLSFFDRAPRDPSLKINSQYKQREFLQWLFGLGPALLYGVLPEPYFSNFCKLVQGGRIMHSYSLTQNDIIEAQHLFVDFEKEFKDIYYQRLPYCLHFVRHSVHYPLHMPSETVRLGPQARYSQMTMERAIGCLGSELRQPSNTYENISRRAVLRSQTNALRAMDPTLLPNTRQHIPSGGDDLGGGYILLPRCNSAHRPVTVAEDRVLRDFLSIQFPTISLKDDILKARRWAKLCLPNGQSARCLWAEAEDSRRRRCVKFHNNRVNKNSIAEVQYFCQYYAGCHAERQTFAVISVYTDPDLALYRQFSRTIWACNYTGQSGLQVINVKDILAVISMVPFPKAGEGGVSPEVTNEMGGKEFLYERMGLDFIDVELWDDDIIEDDM